MPRLGLQLLSPARWTIKGTLIAVPLSGTIVLLCTILLGSHLVGRQLTHIEDKVTGSLEYQHAAQSLVIELEKIQTDLFKLAALNEIGVDGGLVRSAQNALIQNLRSVRRLEDNIDPRVRQMDLEQRLRYVGDAVANATRIPGAPVQIPPETLQEYGEVFRQTETLAMTIAAQTRLLVFDDLKEMRAQTQTLIQWFVVGFGGLGLMIGIGSIMAARYISRPILSLAGAVKALDERDLDVSIPAQDRVDEVGQVARALGKFKYSLQANKLLEQERDDLTRNLERKVEARTAELAFQKEQLTLTQQQAELGRQAMTAQLRCEFGEVLTAASEGDFDQRVVTSFSDENLQALADDINCFVARVNESVAAIGQTMHDLARGELDMFAQHEFSGAFGEIMEQIHGTAAQIQSQSSELNHIALHDALTALPNRRFLEERLTDYTKLLSHGDLPLAVLHIDLDRFKEINDTMGHAAGDAVLVHAAKILSDRAENDDFVARAGGDEFIMLCPLLDDSAKERARIQTLGDRIVEEMSKPLEIDGQSVSFGASIGIAFSTRKTTDLSTLVVDADIALYQAKEAGRNQAQIYSPDIATILSEKRTLREDLAQAFVENSFVPFFQPKFDARTRELAGVEALARWLHPQKGLLTPDKFLPAAEELQVVDRIDGLILSQSIAAVEALCRTTGTQVPELSVNVSYRRLFDPNLLTELDAMEAPCPISLELLESIFFDEQDNKFYWILDALRERGVTIQLDDFGSGRASISALVNIRPDWLKIDRHIIAPLTESPEMRQLVKGIIEMASSMGIGVTAEGVETMEHADILRDFGCDRLQGYAFSKPLPAAALASVVTRKIA